MHDHREALARDGFVLLRGAVSSDTFDELDAALRSLRERGAARSRQVLYTHRPAPAGRPELDALMDQWLSPHRLAPPNTRGAADALRGLVAVLLGVDPVLFQDLLLVKRPGQRRFPWHQDFPYWPVDVPRGVVLWVPLSDAGSERGGLAFARGSHRLGPRPVVDLHVGAPQDPDAELGFAPERFEIIRPQYRRGDAVAFSPTIFHGSPQLQVTQERAAWSSIWLDPAVRWRHANAPNHPLCRVVTDGELVKEFTNVD